MIDDELTPSDVDQQRRMFAVEMASRLANVQDVDALLSASVHIEGYLTDGEISSQPVDGS